MAGNNHLLQKVTFEVGLTTQDGAFEIQNRISNAFQSRILNELERLFDKKFRSNQVITIERMEINLGNLSSVRLEDELSIAMEREVESFLAAVELELNTNFSSDESWSVTDSSEKAQNRRKINLRWPLAANPHFEAEITVSEDSISFFEKFIFLLQYGIHPVAWKAGASKKLSEIIAGVFSDHPEKLVEFVRKNKDNRRIVQRLVLNLTVEQLQYLSSLLGCPFSYDLPKLVQEFERFLKSRSITGNDLVSASIFATQELTHHIWFSILIHYVLRDEKRMALPSVPAESPDAKTALLVKLMLAESNVIRKILGRSTGKITSHEKRHFENVARAIEIIKKSSAHYPGSKPGELKSKGGQNALSEEMTASSIVQREISKPGDDAYKAIEPTIFKGSGSPESDEPIQLDTGIYIGNAGLIILAPYFIHLFRHLNLLEGKTFINKEASIKAVHLLQYACGFENKEDFEGYSEHDLCFNKILCGLEITEPVPETLELSVKEKEEVSTLLKAVLNNWTIMQRSSVHALQITFLQKQGRLSKLGSDWELLVERDSAVEILIDKLPWGISMIKLPWNEFTIHTQW